MVDEKDEYVMHDEGEYHFSDDQVNYEAEPGETAKVAPAVPAMSAKDNLIATLKPYRRMLIGVLVFFVLIFVIYKMLSSSAPQQPTVDFNNQTSAPAKPVINATPKPLVPTPVAQSAPPPQSVAPVQQPSAPPAPVMSQPTTQPVNMPPAPVQAMAPPLPPPSQPPSVATTSPAPVIMPMQTTPEAPVAMQPMSPVSASNEEMASAQNKMLMDRVAVIEDQNTKLMNLVQSQVAQKMAEYQASDVAMKERVHILNKRLANMEASLNKMAQIMQEEGLAKPPAPSASGNPGLPLARPATPKMIYTVQAIIPGRAWLKSDNGDTVTVAEGDMLKDYGRINKIDPYDGIVEIDTGNKMISLSYGSGGD